MLVPFSPKPMRWWRLAIFRRRYRCLQILSSQRTGALRYALFQRNYAAAIEDTLQKI